MTELDTASGLDIDPERDEALTPFARNLLSKFYLRPDETSQQGFARASRAWSGGDMELAQRLYHAVSRGWFMFASPVLSNAPLPGEKVRGLPISCFLSWVPDTLEGLIEHSTETRWLSVLGGGVGGHWSAVRSVSDKAPGPIPFIHTMDADMGAFAQGTTRRGSYAAYLDVSHPDIMEFLNLRIPTGGDVTRKCHSTGFHNAVNITDEFMRAVQKDLPWKLIDPNEHKVRETVRARDLWEAILDTRYRTGEPYLHFIDTANRSLPEAQKELGLHINGSNLCIEIELPTAADRTAVCCLSSLNAEKYDEWKDTTLVADLICMLDNVLTHFIEVAPDPLWRAKNSAVAERAVGLGLMGFHAYLQQQNVAFESQEAQIINKAMFAKIKRQAVRESFRLGKLRGEAPDMAGTGRRNSHLLALAPNANSAILIATSPSIEPAAANAFTHETRGGNWQVKNRYLEAVLEEHGQNNETIWQDILVNKGSVQHLDFLSDHERAVFKTAIEMDQMWVVQHASDRAGYLCQGQSVNLFFPPRADKELINRVHIAAWKMGVKGLYYLRTQVLNRADSVSTKIVRVALKDATETKEEDGCTSCHG